MLGKVVPKITEVDTVCLSTKEAEMLIGLGILEVAAGSTVKLANRIASLNMCICPRCRSFLHSEYRHDFVKCRCEDEKESIFIDGGNDYCRAGGTGHLFPR